MGTEELVRAILADPANDDIRMALSDHFLEQGQPERADLLREPGTYLVDFSSGRKPILVWAAGEQAIRLSRIEYQDVPVCPGCQAALRIVFLAGRWQCVNYRCLEARVADWYKRAALADDPAAKWCPVCDRVAEGPLAESGCCRACDADGWVRGRRGWRQLGVYDG